ncbi:prealbumin-like fold domain-containing protein, partial [Chitinimonas sp. PSY-7]|uniref:prealbumin-like fold domain-containing protein n=1 Tax=Chitinimonas sp. PSY-7 TaxID=3459088 RepID=UPI00403FF7EF
GGVGPFGFTGTNGVTNQTLTTVTPGTGVQGPVQSVTTVGSVTTITETVPPGYTLTGISCTGLGAGGTATPNLATGTVTLNAAATTGAVVCTFTNVQAGPPTLRVAKTGPASFTANNPGTYNITLSNIGGSATTGLVAFTDTLPTGLTFTAQTAGAPLTCSAAAQIVTCSGTPNLAAGANLVVSYTVAVSPTTTGALTNSVMLTSTGGDPRSASCDNPIPAVGANNASSDGLCAKTTGAVPGGNPSVSKTLGLVNGAAVPAGYLARPGDVLTYNVDIRETTSVGPATTTLTETTPAGTTYTGSGEGWSPGCAAGGTTCTQTLTVTAGSSQAKTFTVTVNNPIPAGVTQLVNAVTSSSGTCASCTVTTPISTPRLTVLKRAGTPNFLGGRIFDVPYRLVVGNTGTITAANVQVNDNLTSTFRAGLPANGGGGVSLLPGSFAVSNGPNTTVCQGNSQYNGLTDSSLLTGGFDLQPGESCVMSFVVHVNFGANPVPTDALLNTGLASSTNPGSGVNRTGFTFTADGQPQNPPTGMVTQSSSIDVAPVSGLPAGQVPPPPLLNPTPTGQPSPTPVSLVGKPLGVLIMKQASVNQAEIGDTVRYTITVRNQDTVPLLNAVLDDILPAGFSYLDGTAWLTVKGGASQALADPAGKPGAKLTFTVGTLAQQAELTLTYRVRVGILSMRGDGINRVTACSGDRQRCSNEARAKVKVTTGVFTSDACLLGKVFVDCNNNHIQDQEELGIPGVRLYLEDGTFFITDVEGKYSYCGLSPKSHVLKVDGRTLPLKSYLTTTSNRNLGDANSLWLDVKNGELMRGDFAEGSCSNTVLEQVKARRSQGEARSVETERKGGPGLMFRSKAPDYPREGTDSANQTIVKPRSTPLGQKGEADAR